MLVLDGAVGVQFLIFEEGNEEKKIVKVVDARGRNRWRKVSGWMRGWVPSPSPAGGELEEVPARDDQRPLLDRRHSASEEGGYGGI